MFNYLKNIAITGQFESYKVNCFLIKFVDDDGLLLIVRYLKSYLSDKVREFILFRLDAKVELNE
jgi:hypothetical protein